MIREKDGKNNIRLFCFIIFDYFSFIYFSIYPSLSFLFLVSVIFVRSFEKITSRRDWTKERKEEIIFFILLFCVFFRFFGSLFLFNFKFLLFL